MEAGSGVAAELMRLSIEGSHQITRHPASDLDTARDKDETRRAARSLLLQKYPVLPNPPAVSAELEAIVGAAPEGSNDWVDNQLLAAVDREAVDFLVTEDIKLIGKARRAGLRERVLTIPEAVATLKGLFERKPEPPPAVRSVKAHELDERDPIFDGLREDYGEVDFDSWLARAKREHRDAWVIDGDSALAGVCLVKTEEEGAYGLSGKALKISTFKIAESSRGRKYGELLLKAIFEYRWVNAFPGCYVTVFERHASLIALLEDFGFSRHAERSPLGELVYIKTFLPDPNDQQISPLEYHLRFGPPAIKFDGMRAFLVPIQPSYEQMLFPDAQTVRPLFSPSEPFSNGLRKAYLCNAAIRRIRPGDVLLFYRSRDMRTVRIAGVVDEVFVSSDAAEIARRVGKRTVYSFEAIESMAQREALAILFRQDRVLTRPISLQELVNAEAIGGVPQTISQVRTGALEWLAQQMVA